MSAVNDTFDDRVPLDVLVHDARRALLDLQRDDGHWLFELEPDVTITAEYLMLQHFLDEVDATEQRKIACYLRTKQAAHGGWSLFEAGDLDLSATVKAYYALKLAGDDPAEPHMCRARDAVLARGGGACANVFTRVTLALFGQVPWRAVPVMPIEIMILPRWFPFHMTKVSYWSRTVIAPLLIVMALKPRARNPRGIGIPELFTTPPDRQRRYLTNPTGKILGAVLLSVDSLLRIVEPWFPRPLRRRAIQAAIDFVTPRLNGDDGLGGIFPAMANAVMALDALGYPTDHPDLVIAKAAVRKLLIMKEDSGYCQPCLSPLWDTVLAAHALLEAGEKPDDPTMSACWDWLLEREIRHLKGDWVWQREALPAGGCWAFQYRNDHYPDVDDTAVVAAALHRADRHRHGAAVERAVRWIFGMQDSTGGWGSFDAENTRTYLNNIPFADHGALLDPPTVDVSARCLSFLGQVGHQLDHPAVRRGVEYLKREQEADGSWYGRWGVNYIYGTWSALSALNAVGEDMTQPYVRRAVDWLRAQQRDDGGWGEDCATYWAARRGRVIASTPSQTAWALLGLMAAGEVGSDAVAHGVHYLEMAPRNGANWQEDLWTGAGFPRVFYLKYHGYSAYFPLWAIARYRNLIAANDRRVRYGL